MKELRVVLHHARRLSADGENDRGSITSLVIGMFLCLLILTAGVTAAGWPSWPGSGCKRLRDGAVAAAVGAVDPTRSSAAVLAVGDPIVELSASCRLSTDIGRQLVEVVRQCSP